MKMINLNACNMPLMRILFILSLIFILEGYEVIHERAYLISFNETINRDFVFDWKKINRTTFALNYSFIVVTEILDKQIMMHFEAYKLVDNEYKQIGAKMVVNGCEFLQKNVFGLGNQFKKYGHIDLCKFTKGKHYLHNFVPDVGSFPKFLPAGSFRIHISAWHHGTFMSDSFWYARVVNT